MQKAQNIRAVRVGGRKTTLCIQSNVAEPRAQSANESNDGNNKRQGENVQNLLLYFRKQQMVARTSQKSSPALVFSYLFSGIPFHRLQLQFIPLVLTL